jgi:hypothetical protein
MYEPIRKSSRLNEKAFLKDWEKRGYAPFMGYVARNNLYDQPAEVIMESLSDLFASNPQEAQRSLGPMATDTTGVNNIIYGAMAEANIVQSANTFSLMGKAVHEHSGFRALTTASSTALPGLAEDSGLPADVIADYAVVEVKPKDLHHGTAISHLQMNLENKDDVLAAANTVEVERQQFYARLNLNLLYDVNDGAPGDAHMASLHGLIESYNHINASAGVVDNSADFYNVDRDSAASWADAYVNYNTSAADTPRTFNLSYLDECITEAGKARLPATSPYGGGILLTGHDTLNVLTQLVEGKQRLGYERPVTVGLNGVNTAPGQEGSMLVDTYKGFPLFVDSVMPEPNSGLPDILGLDTSTVRLSMLNGVEFHSTAGNPYLANGYKDRYAWHMQGNVWVTYPGAQFKLTDIE